MLKNTPLGLVFAPSGLADTAGAPDIGPFRRVTGASEPQARAVVAVESAGRGFTTTVGADGRRVRVPKVLLEAHHVYRHTGALPVSRVAPHLSSRRWNRRLYNRVGRTPGFERRPGEDLQHARFRELVHVGARLEASDPDRYAGAEAVCREAAILSSSWGLGQVLGSHWRTLGYPSLQAFVNAQYAGEPEQLETMARFIRANRLDDDLRRGGASSSSWRGFARGYNGSGYAVHNYHGKLARAYRRAGGR